MFEFDYDEYFLPEDYTMEDLDRERDQMSLDEYLEIMQILSGNKYCEETSGEEKDKRRKLY